MTRVAFGTTVFFDLETGGVSDVHPDIQLAAIATRDWEEVATFERKIQFDVALADPNALAMNCYDRATWLIHAVPEGQVVEEFTQFLQPYRVVEFISQWGNPFLSARMAGHNAARFDGPRVMRMFERNNDRFFPGTAFMPLDTFQLAQWYFMLNHRQPLDLKLPTLCEFFGIDVEGAEHDALIDCRRTLLLAHRLVGGGSDG